MVGLAKQLDYCDEKVHQAAMAGLLHDIGKAQSKLSILNKPGALTDDEFAHMKRHPVVGYELLSIASTTSAVLDACLHHHERLDGLGLPRSPARRCHHRTGPHEHHLRCVRRHYLQPAIQKRLVTRRSAAAHGPVVPWAFGQSPVQRLCQSPGGVPHWQLGAPEQWRAGGGVCAVRKQSFNP